MKLLALKYFFKRNYNKTLQASGVVHKKTKVAIHEEKAISTKNNSYSGHEVTVTYFGGFSKTFNEKNWNIFGAGILKNCVLIKIEW